MIHLSSQYVELWSLIRLNNFMVQYSIQCNVNYLWTGAMVLLSHLWSSTNYTALEWTSTGPGAVECSLLHLNSWPSRTGKPQRRRRSQTRAPPASSGSRERMARQWRTAPAAAAGARRARRSCRGSARTYRRRTRRATAGGAGGGIVYKDSGGNGRYALFFPGSAIIPLHAIIQLGSIYGLVGQNSSLYKNLKVKVNMTYPIIKGGIVSFTRQIASYYGKYNIRVNTICPGAVESDDLKDLTKN